MSRTTKAEQFRAAHTEIGEGIKRRAALLNLRDDVLTKSLSCRSDEGVTVGLIDGIIAVSRVVVRRDLTQPHVIEALRDLASDEDIASLFAVARSLATTKGLPDDEG